MMERVKEKQSKENPMVQLVVEEIPYAGSIHMDIEAE